MINIDWLQFSAVLTGSDLNISDPYQLKYLCETSIFTSVEQLYYKGEIIATISRNPRPSAPIKPETILIKLDNRVLYTRDLPSFITQLCCDIGIVWRSWSRIDVSMDFNNFDGYGKPVEQFIRDFIAGSILKKQRNKTKIKLMGDVHNTMSRKLSGSKTAGNNIAYLKFGTYQSDISYYLYNKSLEFAEVGKKPHIVKAWKKNGIDHKKPVWRLEFSIKDFNKTLIYQARKSDKDFFIKSAYNGEIISYFKDPDFIDPLNISRVYGFLYYHYFYFVDNSPGQDKNVSRRERLELFKHFAYNGSGQRLVDVHRTRDETRAARIFARKVDQYNNEVRKYKKDKAKQDLLNDVLMDIVKQNSLERWALDKLETLREVDIKVLTRKVKADDLAARPGEQTKLETLQYKKLRPLPDGNRTIKKLNRQLDKIKFDKQNIKLL